MTRTNDERPTGHGLDDPDDGRIRSVQCLLVLRTTEKSAKGAVSKRRVGSSRRWPRTRHPGILRQPAVEQLVLLDQVLVVRVGYRWSSVRRGISRC